MPTSPPALLAGLLWLLLLAGLPSSVLAIFGPGIPGTTSSLDFANCSRSSFTIKYDPTSSAPVPPRDAVIMLYYAPANASVPLTPACTFEMVAKRNVTMDEFLDQYKAPRPSFITGNYDDIRKGNPTFFAIPGDYMFVASLSVPDPNPAIRWRIWAPEGKPSYIGELLTMDCSNRDAYQSRVTTPPNYKPPPYNEAVCPLGIPKHSKSSKGAIAGGVIAALVGACLIVGAAVYCHLRKKRLQRIQWEAGVDKDLMGADKETSIFGKVEAFPIGGGAFGGSGSSLAMMATPSLSSSSGHYHGVPTGSSSGPRTVTTGRATSISHYTEATEEVAPLSDGASSSYHYLSNPQSHQRTGSWAAENRPSSSSFDWNISGVQRTPSISHYSSISGTGGMGGTSMGGGVDVSRKASTASSLARYYDLLSRGSSSMGHYASVAEEGPESFGGAAGGGLEQHFATSPPPPPPHMHMGAEQAALLRSHSPSPPPTAPGMGMGLGSKANRYASVRSTDTVPEYSAGPGPSRAYHEASYYNEHAHAHQRERSGKEEVMADEEVMMTLPPSSADIRGTPPASPSANIMRLSSSSFGPRGMRASTGTFASSSSSSASDSGMPEAPGHRQSHSRSRSGSLLAEVFQANSHGQWRQSDASFAASDNAHETWRGSQYRQ